MKLRTTLAQLRVLCRGEKRRGEERRDRVKLRTIVAQLRVSFAQRGEESRGEERRDRVKSDPIQTRGRGSRGRS